MKRMLYLIAASLLWMAGGAVSAHDDWKPYRHGPTFPPVANTLYADECGSCHFAYQPALMPAASWRKVLSRLENHFGENAELSQQTLNELMLYLDANSADKVSRDYRRAQKIMRSLGDLAPLRITDIPYIHRQHHEIPSRLIVKNPDIRSLSNCASCHVRAATGSYAERDIHIPGIEHWEDE